MRQTRDMAGRTRSLLGTIIGYVIVGLVLVWVLNALIGTIFWLIRTLIFALVIGGLIAAYLALKAPGDS